MIIHVDFDGTLCPDPRRAQPSSPPVAEVVETLREYHRRGDTIVVTSSRASEAWAGGWKTRHAARLITTYLRRYNVPHDEVIVGRPAYDVRIDRRAVAVGAELAPRSESEAGTDTEAPVRPEPRPISTGEGEPAGVVPIPGATRFPPLAEHSPVFVYHLHGGIGHAHGVEPCVETDFLPGSHEKVAHLHLVIPCDARGPDWDKALQRAQILARRIGCDGVVIDPASGRPGVDGSTKLVLCAIRVARMMLRTGS
ncbi:MAG: hypothetical protein ACYTGZ_16430 [Planctomycetota bacterium]|jgi:hypothetical protein